MDMILDTYKAALGIDWSACAAAAAQRESDDRGWPRPRLAL